MIKIEKTQIVGLEPTIRGMRNPMNSWEKSDSGMCDVINDNYGNILPSDFRVGKADYDLTLRLAKAGSVDGKFRRMIAVYVDITAPLYWWKEFDTYKVGTVANSCSTMHKIHAKEFTLDDFSHEHLLDHPENGVVSPFSVLKTTIDTLNAYRALYLSTNTKPNQNCVALSDEACAKLKKDIWWQMIQLLPSSYNQKRTVMLNYEVLANIYQHRRNHKLDEWREVCKWIEGLPYSEVITCNVAEKDKNNALTSAITKLKAELQWGDDQIAEFLLEQAMLFTGEKKVDVTHLFNPN